MFMSVLCACMCTTYMCAMSTEARRGHCTPWKWIKLLFLYYVSINNIFSLLLWVAKYFLVSNSMDTGILKYVWEGWNIFQRDRILKNQSHSEAVAFEFLFRELEEGNSQTTESWVLESLLQFIMGAWEGETKKGERKREGRDASKCMLSSVQWMGRVPGNRVSSNLGGVAFF